MSIAVNIITLNGCSSFLQQAINAVDGLVDEIVVCDTGSTDGTYEWLRTRGVKLFREDVQSMGETWTGSAKDIRLTELLNELKNQTESEWILKIDDDEIFPKELIAEIIEMEKTSPIYSIPFLHVGGSLRHHLIKRLFHNIPEVSWRGIYGTETLTLNGKRISSNKCPSTKNYFIHLGGLRDNIDDRQHFYGNL